MMLRDVPKCCWSISKCAYRSTIDAEFQYINNNFKIYQ